MTFGDEHSGWLLDMRLKQCWIGVLAVAAVLTGAVALARDNAPAARALKDSAPVALPQVTQNPAQAPQHAKGLRKFHDKGFRDVTGLVRRGENYVAQATDAFGVRVRVVINARSGEVIGLSEVMPAKK